jgi:hypothetical protein
MCLRVSYKKKICRKFFFCILKSLKKGVEFISQRNGSKDRIRIRTKMSWIPNTHGGGTF